jgi:hypothetical protein
LTSCGVPNSAFVPVPGITRVMREKVRLIDYEWLHNLEDKVEGDDSIVPASLMEEEEDFVSQSIWEYIRKVFIGFTDEECSTRFTPEDQKITDPNQVESIAKKIYHVLWSSIKAVKPVRNRLPDWIHRRKEMPVLLPDLLKLLDLLAIEKRSEEVSQVFKDANDIITGPIPVYSNKEDAVKLLEHYQLTCQRLERLRGFNPDIFEGYLYYRIGQDLEACDKGSIMDFSKVWDRRDAEKYLDSPVNSKDKMEKFFRNFDLEVININHDDVYALPSYVKGQVNHINGKTTNRTPTSQRSSHNKVKPSHHKTRDEKIVKLLLKGQQLSPDDKNYTHKGPIVQFFRETYPNKELPRLLSRYRGNRGKSTSSNGGMETSPP